jgi:hypothetical protein
MMKLVGRVNTVALADVAHLIVFLRGLRWFVQKRLDGASNIFAKVPALALNMSGNCHIGSLSGAIFFVTKDAITLPDDEWKYNSDRDCV